MVCNNSAQLTSFYRGELVLGLKFLQMICISFGSSLSILSLKKSSHYGINHNEISLCAKTCIQQKQNVWVISLGNRSRTC